MQHHWLKKIIQIEKLKTQIIITKVANSRASFIFFFFFSLIQHRSKQNIQKKKKIISRSIDRSSRVVERSMTVQSKYIVER